MGDRRFYRVRILGLRRFQQNCFHVNCDSSPRRLAHSSIHCLLLNHLPTIKIQEKEALDTAVQPDVTEEESQSCYRIGTYRSFPPVHEWYPI